MEGATGKVCTGYILCLQLERQMRGFCYGSTHILMCLFVVLAKYIQLCHKHTIIFT